MIRKWIITVLAFLAVTSTAIAGVTWRASPNCLDSRLRTVIERLPTQVTVTSTCRGHAHNRRVGGAKGSYHLGGRAVDFRIPAKDVARIYPMLLANPTVGGHKHYGGGLMHIDVGPRRTWDNRGRGPRSVASSNRRERGPRAISKPSSDSFIRNVFSGNAT